MNIEWIPSPNFSERKEPISAIILHHTGSLRFKQDVEWCCNPESKVSYHYVIGMNGEFAQLVKDEKKAWHAGKSELWDKPDCNQYSLGIALVGDGKCPFTSRQYELLVLWCKEKIEQYNIFPSWVAPHSIVALPNGRKNDPKPFNVKKFEAMMGWEGKVRVVDADGKSRYL